MPPPATLTRMSNFSLHLGQFERLAHDHACGFAAEEFIQRLAVDVDRAAALAQEHARGGGFATAGAVVLLDRYA